MEIVIDIDENIFTRLFDNGTEDYAIMNDDLFAIAKSIRNGTPLPKTGHWIFCEGIKGKDNVEKCSCCQSHWKEAVIYRNDTQEYLRLRLKHCPNCGAKMIEPSESKDKEN